MTNKRLRVSAASLARIDVDDGILVALNKRSLRDGEKIYTPFGGAIEFYASGKPFLDILGAEYEKGNDLRFTIDESRLPGFEKWFSRSSQYFFTGQDRETSPYRELEEELVDEEKVFDKLSETDLTIKYLRTAQERAISQRSGTETQRYFEIYSVKFLPALELGIKQALAKPDTRLAIVSEDEIREGRTLDNTEIGSNCLPLIK